MILQRSRKPGRNYLPQFGAITSVILLLLVSFYLRSSDISRNIGIQNLETPWHALLTVQAYSEIDAKTHWFLPIVTLGGSRNKGVPWGSAIPDKDGNLYYTSATSPTFVLPYLWFRLTGLDVSIENLAKLNFLLQAISVLMLYGFIYILLRSTNVSSSAAAFSAAAASSISIFSREALVAYGIIYWGPSAYPIFLMPALCFILLVMTRPGMVVPWKLALFTAVCVFGAWLEWEGFVFNLGGAAVVLAYRRSRESMIVAACMVASACIAGAMILVHFNAVVGLPALFDTMLSRFQVRSGFTGPGGIVVNALLLIQGYCLSFGPFLLTLLGCAFVIARSNIRPRDKKLLIFILVLSAVPLGHNLVLIENAGEFSYDRLKFAVPAAIVMAVTLAYSQFSSRMVITAAICVSCILGYWSYREDLKYYSTWETIDASNRSLQKKLAAEPGYDCAVLVTNIVTRAYPTLLFHKMFYETWKLPESADNVEYTRKAIAKTSACKGIFLDGKMNWLPPYTDMAEYVGVFVMTPDGQVKAIPVDPLPPDAEKSLYVRLFSYQGRAHMRAWLKTMLGLGQQE